MNKLSQSIKGDGEAENPISQEKLDNCYTPNGETYPLCKGQSGNELCKECNLYENMIEPYGIEFWNQYED